MVVVSRFGRIGFRRTTSGATFPEGPVGQFYPALHARPDQIAFPPHWGHCGMLENIHHTFP